MYDAYASLGNNCEAGLNFRRIGYEVSGFFRFTATNYPSTTRLIKSNFANVYRKENIVPAVDRMVRDTGTGVVHHTRLLSHQTPNGRMFDQDYDFDSVYEQERSKVNYLIQKWRDLVASDKTVLYIFKHHHSTSRSQAEELLNLLRAQSPQHKCDLLYIQLHSYQEQSWSIDGLFNRYFTKFAPINKAHDYDVAAWDKIFAEFPLNADADRGTRRLTQQQFAP